MMKKKKIIILVSLLWMCYTSTNAQTDNYGLWTSIEVSKQIKKVELNGEVELRTRDYMQNIARVSAKIGAEYSIIKPLKIGVAYQSIYFNDVKYSDFQPRNRFITYLQGKQKWGRFSFNLRERFQLTAKDESDRIKSNGKIDTYKINPEWTWRNRLKVDYNITNCKFTPSISAESFYQLNNPEKNQFEGMRYSLSCAYKINKRQSVEAYVLYDKELNVSDPNNMYVLGLSYSYSFK